MKPSKKTDTPENFPGGGGGNSGWNGAKATGTGGLGGLRIAPSASTPRNVTPGLKGTTIRINSALPGKYGTNGVRGTTASAPVTPPAGSSPKTFKINSGLGFKGAPKMTGK